MLVEILKPVVAGDVTHQTGDIVDASDWKYLRQLIEQRKIRPVAVQPPEQGSKPLKPKAGK